MAFEHAAVRRMRLIGIALLAVWLFAWPLPNYLLHGTSPVKADAVVLLAGRNLEVRKKMAEELVAGGWGKFIILPATGEIIASASPNNSISSEKVARITKTVRQSITDDKVEGTHIDMLQARAILKPFELSRIIFVSSPYHMRRIKIIAARVFDEGRYKVAFVPTAYEPPHRPWFTSRADIKWVLSEYGKIIWFLIYEPFFKE